MSSFKILCRQLYSPEMAKQLIVVLDFAVPRFQTAWYNWKKSIYLCILPYALADILGRVAQRLLVSDRKKKSYSTEV